MRTIIISVFVMAISFAACSQTQLSPQMPASAVAPALHGPDLVISSFWIDPKHPTSTDDICFRVIVTNSGSEDAPASTVSIKVGGEAPASAPRYAVPELRAGSAYQVIRWEKLDVAQRYRAIATADRNDVVDESNEDNNSKELDFIVSSAPMLQ